MAGVSQQPLGMKTQIFFHLNRMGPSGHEFTHFSLFQTSWARDFHHFTPRNFMKSGVWTNILWNSISKMLLNSFKKLKMIKKSTSTSTSLKVLVLLQERFPLYTPNCSSREALQQVWQLLSHLGTSSYSQLLFAAMPRTPVDPWWLFWGSVSSQIYQGVQKQRSVKFRLDMCVWP